MREIRAGKVGYLPVFDGLRAIAVMLVLLNHYPIGYLDPLTSIIPIGHIGLHLFLVLSGFLITSVLIETKGMLARDDGPTFGKALTNFYSRRIIRIMPIYYLLLFLEFFWGNEGFRQVVWWHAAFLSNTVSAVFSGPLATGDLIHPPTGHLWSLSIEMQFYSIWPILLLCLRTKQIIALSVLLVLLGPLSRALFFALGYQSDVGYLPSATDMLCFGALAAMWHQGWIPQVSLRTVRALGVLGLFVFVICATWSIQGIWYRPQVVLYPIAEGLIFSWLLLAFEGANTPPFVKLLGARPIVYIGRISYAIYLYHAFVWDTLVDHVIDISESHALAQSALAILATILVASVSWWMIEKPILGFRRRLT